MEKKLPGLVLVLAYAVVCVASGAQIQIEWFNGEDPPTEEWTLEPANPTTSDVISFSGYTEVIGNMWCAEEMTVNPNITIYDSARFVELTFDGGAGECFWYFWNPVYGYIQGSFGPLAEGDWTFFSLVPAEISVWMEFHVSPLSLVGPDGGEFLESDSRATIAWSDSRSGPECVGNYLLEYSSDDGQTWNSIGPGPVSNACSYEWFVPTIESHECLVRVTDADDATVSDTSSNLFSTGACACYGDIDHDDWISPADISALVALVIPRPECQYYWVPVAQGLGGGCWAHSCADMDRDGWASPIDISALVSILLPHQSNYYWLACD